MRSVQELCVRAFSLSAVLLGAAFLAGPGCFVKDLIDSGQDCTASCNVLNECGLIQTSDCGAYCAGLVTGAVIAGCNDQFDAQNACAETNTQCGADSAAMCAPQTEAFAQCMKDYCTMHPTGEGCSQLGGGGGDGGTP
jgi:hypothetical protein